MILSRCDNEEFTIQLEAFEDVPELFRIQIRPMNPVLLQDVVKTRQTELLKAIRNELQMPIRFNKSGLECGNTEISITLSDGTPPQLEKDRRAVQIAFAGACEEAGMEVVTEHAPRVEASRAGPRVRRIG